MTIKTPWKHDKENYPAKDGIIQDTALLTVCRVARTNQAENIAVILRAVNAHDALIAAAQEAQDLADTVCQKVFSDGTCMHPLLVRNLAGETLDKLRAALALAEGQAPDV